VAGPPTSAVELLPQAASENASMKKERKAGKRIGVGS
jgi:hypothetical protein